MSDTPTSPITLFSDLNLSEPLIRSLKDVGYETPSPIQAATIPLLLDNQDVLGQAPVSYTHLTLPTIYSV